MPIQERILELVIVVVLIFGGYQFYFWAQRQQWYPARYWETKWDDLIKYDPRWVWIYSGLYYPMILLAALSVPTWRDFALLTGCFLTLLFVQMGFFLFMPVAIPYEWRAINRVHWDGSLSQQFLDFVWHYDKLRNCVPSMHVSVAMMTDLAIGRTWPIAGYVGLAFPLLIAVSALKTKQHYVIDVVPGAALGALVWWLWHQWMV